MDYGINPKTGQATIFFFTYRNLDLRNIVYLGDLDSPCYATESEALDFDIPWDKWERRASLIAVESEDGAAFSAGDCDGRVVRARSILPPRPRAGSGFTARVAATSTVGEWKQDVAEPLGLLHEGRFRPGQGPPS